MARSGP